MVALVMIMLVVSSLLSIKAEQFEDCLFLYLCLMEISRFLPHIWRSYHHTMIVQAGVVMKSFEA